MCKSQKESTTVLEDFNDRKMTTFQHINNTIINHNYKLQSDWISAALLALTMGLTLIIKQYLSYRSNWTVGVIIHITAVNRCQGSFQILMSTFMMSIKILLRYLDSVLLLFYLKFCFRYYTVEPRLTTTPFIRPPRYYGHILSNQT